MKKTKLKNYLEKNNISQSVFAEKLGISSSALSRYINGSRSIPLSMAIKIEKLTKKEVECKHLV